MDAAIAHGCALPFAHHFPYCHLDVPIENRSQNPNHLEVRQQTAPDGQVLPEWLTWSPVRILYYEADDSTRLPLMEKLSKLARSCSYP
jgi:hypothetical protein